MMAVYTPTDKRFRRAHIKPSRRRRAVESRRRLLRGTCLLALLSLGAYWAPSALQRSVFLQIDTIAIEGNQHLSSGEVLALVGQLRGENILLADLDAHRERLLTSGWVEEATLRRLLPSTIEVRVEERTPVGLGRFATRLYLVDEFGTVIDEHGPRFTNFDLPVIDGLSAGGTQEIVIDPARVQLAAHVIAELETRPDLVARVSQIDVRDSFDAVVLLSDDPTLIRLGHERFVERLQEYLELAPALRTRVPNIDYVDLRFEQRIYVRPVDPGSWSPGRALLASTGGAQDQ